ncbi:HmuY family protein [Marinifilum caeruleilacunae]|uniref:HmuY protein n=1 Tax=Marinifilum caeruleilacunae TaxID=2499076 RepID=A0ABX1WQX1_9BACT|nr:HmuY family protein [Marinifilum caeruleilacunae]NOU58339.1 hypothetical protein [Marinifilum caeruleilacunae]
MKKNKLIMMFVALATMVGFSSCDDDDDPVNAIEKEVTIDASSYTEWVYFSFEKGDVVGTSNVDEERAGLDWDIAFHRYDVRLNCGESGDGNGGAFLSEGNIAKTGWDAILEAPETGYSVDTKQSVIKNIISGGDFEYAEVGATNVITGGMVNIQAGMEGGSWLKMSYSPGANGPSYEATNQIFVVKTADGKYAKIWLKRYVNEANETGKITMKYAYQEDGSKKLN